MNDGYEDWVDMHRDEFSAGHRDVGECRPEMSHVEFEPYSIAARSP